MERHIAADLLREARARAGLTQRALAERAGTAQSVVARIEKGQASPTWGTLTHLLASAGFDLRPRLELKPTAQSHMLADVDRILALSPEARLRELANVSRFLASARRV
ncbi:MAG TPA: helix-turn-helix domain-containing protein [Gemmatimonadales bacterium]|jgi:transcriptional regulator with XRE-family HTH domain|nr:helix-turn-helix domain-containing protein [Gemmatimonadales bacterium]